MNKAYVLLTRAGESRLGAGIWWIVIVAVVAVQSALVLTHQPWLDEYQALQIALQSPDQSALMENLRYEGHPPLWYWLLQAASLILPTRWILPGVQWPIALGIQALILSRREFSRLERALLAVSPVILFDYGALSRSLSLGVFLTLFAFAFRDRRIAWIAVVLMPMADFLFGLLSIAWLALRIVERRMWWPGMSAWLCSGLFSAWSVRPAPDIAPALALTTPIKDLGRFFERLSPLLVPLPIWSGRFEWNTFLPSGIALPVGALFIPFLLYCCARPRMHMAIMAAFLGVAVATCLLIYPLPIRHLSLACVLLLVLVARARRLGVQETRLFSVWLWVLGVTGLIHAAIGLTTPFHRAGEAAAWIRNHHLGRKHWAVFPTSIGQGVAAQLGIELERVGYGCTLSFVRWNVKRPLENDRQLFDELQRMRDHYGRFYLLTDRSLPTEQFPGVAKPLHRIAAGFEQQQFHFFMVGADKPERTVPPPQCPPRRLPMPRW